MLWFLVLSCAIITAEAGSLPSYIKKCSRNDPELNECTVRNANLAISQIANGDKKLKIPNMKPFRLNEVLISPSENFKMHLKNVDLYGLETGVATSANVQLDKDRITFTVQIPDVRLESDYSINGRVLILPIEGKGKAHMRFLNGTYTYSFDLEYYEKNGERYGRRKTSSLKYVTQKVTYDLENLFNGNKRLGDEMNRFLNENWDIVGQDLRPAIQQIVDTIITSIMEAVMKQIPWDSIFPEKV